MTRIAITLFTLATFVLLRADLTAQVTTDTICTPNNILENAPCLSKKRLIGTSIGTGVVYGATMVGLNSIWYGQYDRSRFRLFNDNGEWLQMDKAGHTFTTYFETAYAFHVLRWIGMDEKKSTWYGAGVGMLLQTSIEVMDGFASKWGASPGDMVANAAGAGMFVGQQLTWGEQRLILKTSTYLYPDADEQLRHRADDLYGTTIPEQLIKNYNDLSIWLSISPSLYNPNQRRLKWLNLAVGYGIGDVYGGFNNTWTDEEGNLIDRTDVERFRRFYLSVDADLTKIPVRSRGGRIILSALNVFKMPAPALEINTKGEISFHPVFFLNWSQPIYLKR